MSVKHRRRSHCDCDSTAFGDKGSKAEYQAITYQQCEPGQKCAWSSEVSIGQTYESGSSTTLSANVGAEAEYGAASVSTEIGTEITQYVRFETTKAHTVTRSAEQNYDEGLGFCVQQFETRLYDGCGLKAKYLGTDFAVRATCLSTETHVYVYN